MNFEQKCIISSPTHLILYFVLFVGYNTEVLHHHMSASLTWGGGGGVCNMPVTCPSNPQKLNCRIDASCLRTERANKVNPYRRWWFQNNISYLHTKFHNLSSNGPLLIDIKPKATENLRLATVPFYILHTQKIQPAHSKKAYHHHMSLQDPTLRGTSGLPRHTTLHVRSVIIINCITFKQERWVERERQ
jgi:hypothetical protein